MRTSSTSFFPAATLSTEWITAPLSRRVASILSKSIPGPSIVIRTLSVSWSTSSMVQFTPSTPLIVVSFRHISTIDGLWGFRTSSTILLMSLKLQALREGGFGWGRFDLKVPSRDAVQVLPEPRVRVLAVFEPHGVEGGDLVGPDRRAEAGDPMALPNVVDRGRDSAAEPGEVPEGGGGHPEVELRLPLRQPRRRPPRDPEGREVDPQEGAERLRHVREEARGPLVPEVPDPESGGLRVAQDDELPELGVRRRRAHHGILGRVRPPARLEVDGPVLREDREPVREEAGDVTTCVDRGDVKAPEVPAPGFPRRGGKKGGLDVAGDGLLRGEGHDAEVRAEGERLFRRPQLCGPRQRASPLRGEDDPVRVVDPVVVEPEEIGVHPGPAVEPPLGGAQVFVSGLLPARERVLEPAPVEFVLGRVEGDEGRHVLLRRGPDGHVHPITGSSPRRRRRRRSSCVPSGPRSRGRRRGGPRTS